MCNTLIAFVDVGFAEEGWGVGFVGSHEQTHCLLVL